MERFLVFEGGREFQSIDCSPRPWFRGPSHQFSPVAAFTVTTEAFRCCRKYPPDQERRPDLTESTP